jgi:hypothetical protein
MKAIETTYSGIRFRSKTEAKWALFMDIIGCKWIYEPEGYNLGDGVFYCPDFYLPDIDAFLEIKPIIAGFESPTHQFVRATKKTIYTMRGTPCHWRDREPDDREMLMFMPDEDSLDGIYVGWDNSQEFCICPHCRKVGIEYDGRTDRIKCNCKKSNHGNKGYNWDDPLLLKAYKLTRSAFRWEK